MAPSRGKGRRRAVSAARARNSARSSTDQSIAARVDEVPDVYRDMLQDVGDDLSIDDDRPLKKRKTVSAERQAERQKATDLRESSGHQASSRRAQEPKLQTVEDSSEQDDASDLEFEDVDIGVSVEAPSRAAEEIEDLSITVQQESSTKAPTIARRKPATSAEKSHRLMVHKLHLLCLLGHCMYINGRCNNAAVQRTLRPLLSAKTMSYLNPKTNDTQFQRNRSFIDGLEQAVATFVGCFQLTGGGLIRPQWDTDNGTERKYNPVQPMDMVDFKLATKNLEGTQDVASQLFCALLRSVGVSARVICSLQALPFTSVPKSNTPRKETKERIFAVASEFSPPKVNSSAEDTAVNGSASIGSVPSTRRRIGQPSFAAISGPATPPKKKSRPIPKLSYPVFWVEAFNAAHQKWISVDPVVTHTINKDAKLEPPFNYDLNQMRYVIAFEDDGSAHDVTRRYAKAFNAKTRRQRVESSPQGTKWLKEAMSIFRRRNGRLDRDQLEHAELAQKEAREGMPRNILDFKDHPYYALERHLKRHEIIHPKREVGKVNAGTAANPRMESVFRRQDVVVCKSGDKWYRLGRVIREGEQPLKHVPARAGRAHSVEAGDDNTQAALTGLYASYQTELYVPPPVQHGRIAKNVYGNLDVYVPSMVPAGGVHVRHELAKQAAKLLHIDFADAVVGFRFQGRHGTAIVDGIVVAQQFETAVRAVIDGLEEQVIEDEDKRRSLVAIRAWKRLMTALRIREEVETTYGTSSAAKSREEQSEKNSYVEYKAHARVGTLTTAGRYTLAELALKPRKANRKWTKTVDDSENSEDSHEPAQDDADEAPGNTDIGGGFLPTDAVTNPVECADFWTATENEEDVKRLVHRTSESGDGGGGFLIDDDEAEGGFEIESEKGKDHSSFEHDTKARCCASAENESHSHGDECSGSDKQGTETYDVEERDLVDNDAEPVNRRIDSISQKPGSESINERFEIDEAPVKAPSAAMPTEIHATPEPSDGEPSDAESMLSHDPEDDDAEPDWLESD